MTTGGTGSPDVRGDDVREDVRADKEESDVPFDPEATGVIPKLTFDSPPAGEGSGAADDSAKSTADSSGSTAAPSGDAGSPTNPAVSSGGSADSSGDDGSAASADQTTAIRLPSLHIGRRPTGRAGDDAAVPTRPGVRSQPPSGPQTAGGKQGASEAQATTATKPGAPSQPSSTPRPPGPKPSAPQPTGPKPSGPKPSGPQPTDSKPSGPQSNGPQSNGPQPSGDAEATDGSRPATGPKPEATRPPGGSGSKPATPAKPGTPAEGSTGTPSTTAASATTGSPAGAPPKSATPAQARPGTASPVAGTQPMKVQPTGTPAPAAPAPVAPSTDAPGTGGPAKAGSAGSPPVQAGPGAGGAVAGAHPSGGPATGAAPGGARAGAAHSLKDLVRPATAPPPGGGAPAQSPQGPPAQAGPAQGPPLGRPPGKPQQAAKPRTLRARAGALVASAPKWLPVLLTLEGLVMYVLALKVPPGPLRGVDPADIDGLGLISALPTSAFIAILIMLVSFFVTVSQSTDRKFLLLFQIAAITFALHGAGALVAEEPRFPTAYIHAGFVEFIGRTGETAINIDARMGWPGFFALFAFVTKAAGISDMTTILQWTPLLSNLLYLLPFVLILRQVVATTRARWFAALLFVLVQWIGQDYFSPQGFTFALYLAFVAILLRWFGRVEPRTKPIPPKGLRKWLGKLDAMTPGELANTGTFRADKLLMLMMLVALFVASVASHQITPFMMLGVLTAFLIFRRTTLTWALPFFLGLMVLAWISYMTVGFWASQIDTIFGGLGNILANLRSNTGDRIEGTDPAHAMVLQARLGILAVILGCAAAGLFRRLRRGVFDRSALILLCVPVLALGLQSYGGEIGLRIYMFALPGACLLAAYAFFPNLPADSADVREETVPLRKRNVRFNPELTKKISLVLAACFAIMFAMAFFLARYGNEKFERVTTGEVAALHYVYDHDSPSAKVLYLVPKEGPEVTPTLPWGERDVERVNFAEQALVFKDPAKIENAVAKLKTQPRNSYLMVSRGQVSYLQLNEGFPPDWGERFRAALDKSPDLKKVLSNDDAALYTWKKFVRGTEIPEPNPYKGRGDPTTPWTPVGIGALAVTWVTLFGYEIIRLNGPTRAPRARKRLLFLAVPAFAIALAVIVERFIYIAQNN
ncbi:hypothetical protein [Nonomuraea fuscirosea]|uniref:hypothetical protein n=1 Tax=Nonomuraea fuscirosea TaxID=1291556 RepID=UPI003430AC40